MESTYTSSTQADSNVKDSRLDLKVSPPSATLSFSRHLIGCSQRLLEVFGPTEALLPEQYVERGLMVVLLIPKC